MNIYPTINMEATGNRIRELRKEKHMRVTDIATYMGFESQQAIYKWQRGESLPTVDNLYALSRLFGTTMDDILVENSREGEDTPSHDGNGLRALLTKLNCWFIVSRGMPAYNYN